MSAITKAAQKAQIDSRFADNTNEEMSPLDFRTVANDETDSSAYIADVATITAAWVFAVSPTVPEPTAVGDAVNKAYVDLLVEGVTEPLVSVLDRFDPTSATPAAPSTGDRYLSTATANGWTEHNIYEWNGASWDETAAVSGQAVFVEDENIKYFYTGTLWVKSAGIVDHNDLNSLQGGTSAEYYHLTSAQHTGIISKSASETISGAYTFTTKVVMSGGMSFLNAPITTAINRAATSADNSVILGVTAATTQTLPNSAGLAAGWSMIIDNQIAAGGTVTINKNAGDVSGIMLHPGLNVDDPILELKYTACTIWWDGTNFHLRGAIS